MVAAWSEKEESLPFGPTGSADSLIYTSSLHDITKRQIPVENVLADRTCDKIGQDSIPNLGLKILN